MQYFMHAFSETSKRGSSGTVLVLADFHLPFPQLRCWRSPERYWWGHHKYCHTASARSKNRGCGRVHQGGGTRRIGHCASPSWWSPRSHEHCC